MSPVPGCRPGRWPDGLPAARVAARIATAPPGSARYALLGMPDDEGIRLNGGRVGAADGPDAFRAALARYGAADPGLTRLAGCWDAGDVIPGATLEATHDNVRAAARWLAGRGHIPIGIGGGHDLTWPLVGGVTDLRGPAFGVYLDAHLDVRETRGSGMPFRRLRESGAATGLAVIGLDRFANATEHVDWFLAHGGTFDALTPDTPWPGERVFVSVDLDVLDAAHAPGVSAMNPCGMDVHTAERWCHAAGSRPELVCFDLMELSPPFDPDGRTARVAARLFLAFLEGAATRP